MSRARLLLAGLLLVGTTGATPGSPIRAELDGETIAPAAVGDHYCHDFDWPQIRCFTTAAALEAAVRNHLRDKGAVGAAMTMSLSTAPVTASATKYVKVFELGAFAGNIAFLSRDYPDLNSIGWGDKISSYIVYNNASGEFYTHWWYSGAIDYYCCNQSVAALSSTYDDQFSSFDLN